MLQHPRSQPAPERPGELREGLELALEGGLFDPIEALGEGGLQAIRGWRFNRAEDGPEGLVHGPAGAKAVAVGFALRFPLRFQPLLHERWLRSVIPRGNREGPECARSGFRNPPPAGRVSRGQRREPLDDLLALAGSKGGDALYSRRPLAVVVLGNPAYCQRLRRPRLP
jgi:hypothetical protein